MRKPRVSLRDCFGILTAVAILAWFVANYESWYGVKWTRADAARLVADLEALEGEITEGLAVRVAIDAAAGSGRVLPTSARRGTRTRYVVGGDPTRVECWIVHLDYIPEGIGGAFTRIPGGHCTVYVALDGSVLAFVGGA